MAPVTTRRSAEERKEAILEVALEEFAERGLHGTSTEDIARRAGISQPYVFRLFGTKKELFAGACALAMRRVREAMEHAAEGLRGEDALDAMGQAYIALLEADPRILRLKMHMYASSGDRDVRDVARQGFGDLVTTIERIAGPDSQRLTRFVSIGMLINVIAAMELRQSGLAWADRLMEGCREESA